MLQCPSNSIIYWLSYEQINKCDDFVSVTKIRSHKLNDRRKVMVCGRILSNNTLIGPVFVKGNLNGNRYQQIMDVEAITVVQNQYGVLDNGAIDRIWFFQVCATLTLLQMLFRKRMFSLGHGIE